MISTAKTYIKFFINSSRGVQKVGEDLEGNLYYSAPNEMGYERRWVEYKKEPELYEGTTKLPVQWRSWLNSQRRDPPTIQELKKSEQHQIWLKERVKELESEEEKLLLQEKLDQQRGISRDPVPQVNMLEIIRKAQKKDDEFSIDKKE